VDLPQVTNKRISQILAEIMIAANRLKPYQVAEKRGKKKGGFR
jgi:hypothetical protein